jgi:release factor glutamine methyltransferase
VEQVLNEHQAPNISLLDLGTGTGAIALALAHEQPSWQVQALDFNLDAVALAQENAHRLKLKNVTIFQSNWFDMVDPETKFDVIVSNPPYIDSQDPHLAEGDVRFEPKSALVADNQGLADIEKIASQARDFFKATGQIYFEHGWQQAEQVQTILNDLGYEDAQSIKDYGNNYRVTSAVYRQK